MSSKLIWIREAWEDYLYWQTQDKNTLQKINQLITAIQRDPFKGPGKPEPLKNDLQGYWSRRIDSQHRIVYAVETDAIVILQCRYHYQK